MNDMTIDHPNVVLDTLLAKGGRSHRRAKLTAMHEICRRHQESGFHDFSLPTIGRFAEAEGILKGRVLYNAQSADYRTLVSAWAAFVGQPAPQAPKPLASHEYLMRIHDPAIRAIMQTIIGERDKLKAEVNLLKSNTQVVVDRRPVGVRAASAAASLPGTMLGHHEQLTPSEREALQKAVSADHLEKQGLREGTHGEILNERGRAVFISALHVRYVRSLAADRPLKETMYFDVLIHQKERLVGRHTAQRFHAFNPQTMHR